MKVLSIDLDYIMGPTIELYNGLFFDDNPSLRWRQLYDFSDFKEHHFYIDQSNLLFCYNTFLKSIKKCKNVAFGYEHDSILFDLKDGENIEIINIDHHDDFFGGDYEPHMGGFEREYQNIVDHGIIHEGNWGAWLSSIGKLKSFTWIGNSNSSNKKSIAKISQHLPNFSNVEKENYQFDNYQFDYIFVCLSPQYVPKNHWHYFSMFISVYEELTGNTAKIITNKFETSIRHLKINDEILHQRSNGR